MIRITGDQQRSDLAVTYTKTSPAAEAFYATSGAWRQKQAALRCYGRAQ